MLVRVLGVIVVRVQSLIMVRVNVKLACQFAEVEVLVCGIVAVVVIV